MVTVWYPSGKVNYDFFPSAAQVANMDIATLRTAGLSGRKAEYGISSLVFRPLRRSS